MCVYKYFMESAGTGGTGGTGGTDAIIVLPCNLSKTLQVFRFPAGGHF